MAGMKFEYDESGSTFFYFLTSFLGLALLPCTFYFWPAVEGEEEQEKDRCEVFQRKLSRLKKPEKWKGLRKTTQRFLILAGWALMAILVYKLQQFDYEYANFDPYDILGVGVGTSIAEIKKAYRKQSLIYHPDKPTGDERKFMRLNKAYLALTDDDARRNYERYGHPDGPGAMHFGIALPSWIVEKENSLWVLGLYGLVFMIALPTVVAIWWYRSSKFSNDQVLLDTTQLYYYFFHKTPHMVFKRALMVLAASLEFEKGHNPEIVERPTDNIELPQLIKQLPNLGEKNKERPLCFAYSMKARSLLHAHLSRMKLPDLTLDQDRLYIVKCCPILIQEMVTCVSQLIMLAHAGRISRLPSLDTIEACMKLSPHIVQALWDSKNPLLQLPHVTEDSLRHFVSKRRPVKTIDQLLTLSSTERHHVLRSLSEEEFSDVMLVCRKMPKVEMNVNYEVVDDDDSGVFTAGAIVTVTVNLRRRALGEVFEQTLHDTEHKPEGQEKDEEALAAAAAAKKSGWKKPQPKKGGKSKSKSQPQKKKQHQQSTNKKEDEHLEEKKERSKKVKIAGSQPERVEVVDEKADQDTDEDESASHSDESVAEEADTESHREDKHANSVDDDAEWEKFQKGLTKREKALEGKSRMSHAVHCPYFPDDKQEYWWTYVCDRKKHMLITAPYQITNLVDHEEVQLKFTAPQKPGIYTYQVCLRSDSYLGLDQSQDIKLDVKEAREIPTEHPQWQECSSDEEDDDENDVGKDDGEDSEYTTDEEVTDESDEE
ncbi:translocation protein SEC63 homolog isoform X1 [Procambarus clarkii]|uniref:translocation protein SEC63 homolog isoform X1 n=1 Tax=Procambarus clarkii TaxID=6728 RepID=UPI001E678B68|nr:translocation protein SEC63 homolog isoform X1 [Procambarus clarkii]